MQGLTPPPLSAEGHNTKYRGLTPPTLVLHRGGPWPLGRLPVGRPSGQGPTGRRAGAEIPII
jgi:hypothetical protein